MPMFGERPDRARPGRPGGRAVRPPARRRALPAPVRRGVPRRSPTRSALGTITKALAAFERTLISGNSPYDRYVLRHRRQRHLAPPPSAARCSSSTPSRRGTLRECFHCHGGFNFTASVDHAGKVAERPFHNNAPLQPALRGLRPAQARPARSATPRRRPAQCDGTGPQAMGCYPPDNTGAVRHHRQRPADMGTLQGADPAQHRRHRAVHARRQHRDAGRGARPLRGRRPHDQRRAATPASAPRARRAASSSVGFDLTATQKDDLLAFLRGADRRRVPHQPALRRPVPAGAPARATATSTARSTVNELVTGGRHQPRQTARWRCACAADVQRRRRRRPSTS